MFLTEPQGTPEKSRSRELDAPSEDTRYLLAAAAIIERDGHCKSVLYLDDPLRGPVCLIGSILRAVTGTSEGWTQKNTKHDYVLKLAGRVHPHMAAWNDAKERTKDEVVAKIRSAALGG